LSNFLRKILQDPKAEQEDEKSVLQVSQQTTSMSTQTEKSTQSSDETNFFK